MCATVVKVKLACQWGKPQKRVFLKVSEDVLMPFCVAGVALCDISHVSGGMCVHGRGVAKVYRVYGECHKNVSFSRCHMMLQRVFPNVSEDVLMSFCVAGVALCDA